MERKLLLCTPLGELFDLIACWQIARGAEEKIIYDDPADTFDAMVPEHWN